MNPPSPSSKKRMVSMSDIAARVGLSRATVSVVLNDRYQDIGIAEETRQRILSVAAEMGYRRNELALAVKTGKSRTLGFLSGTVDLEFSSRFFSGILDEAEDRDYSIQRFRISNTWDIRGTDHSLAERALVRCVEHRLAGVIVYDPDSHLPFDAMRREFERHEVPAVLLDFQPSEQWNIGVASDDAQGARLAVQHLVELGHKHIVFMGGVENYGTAIPRFAGYEAAMKENGLEGHIRGLWMNWDYKAVLPIFHDLVAEKNAPTAMIVGSDEIALSAFSYFPTIGKSLPHDLSIIGFGNLMRTGFSYPPLTTVAVPYEQIGREAVRLLLDEETLQKQLQREAEWKVLPTRLVVRGSTAPPHK